MKKQILIYKENDVNIDLENIIKFLNIKIVNFAFFKGYDNFEIPDQIIRVSSTYESIISLITNDIKDKFVTVLLTNKPYSNNFFCQSYEKEGQIFVIISFSGWHYLTNLSQNNGFIFFLFGGLVELIDNEQTYICQSRGCLFNRLFDKTKITDSMKFAGICENCLDRILKQNLTNLQKSYLNDLKTVFNDLANSSKWNQDIVSFWNEQNANKFETADIKKLQPTDFMPHIMTNINLNRVNINNVHESYTTLINETDANKKGRAFEIFSKAFFSLIADWSIISENPRLTDAELDLVFSNNNRSLFDLGNVIYIECKNKNSSANVQDISHFAINMLLRNVNTGVFFSFNGISGYNPQKPNQRPTDGYERILSIYRKLNIKIIPFEKDDIECIKNGENIVTLIRNKINNFHII